MKIHILLCFFATSMIFAECGLIRNYETIIPNAGLLGNHLSFQIKECDEKKCGYAFLLSKQQELYGCSSKEEYVKSLKDLFNREINVAEKKKIYSYAGIAKKHSVDMIRVGCDFVFMKPIYSDITLSGYFYPRAEGFCPVTFNQKELSFLFIEKKKDYAINLKQIRKIQDKTSELVYFDEFFPIYIKPCEKNRCDFILSETLPTNDKTRKAVVIKNVKRIDAKCSTLQIEPSLESDVTGVFVVNKPGVCGLRIKYKSGEVDEITIKISKENDEYNLLIGAKK